MEKEIINVRARKISAVIALVRLRYEMVLAWQMISRRTRKTDCLLSEVCMNNTTIHRYIVQSILAKKRTPM